MNKVTALTCQGRVIVQGRGTVRLALDPAIAVDMQAVFGP